MFRSNLQNFGTEYPHLSIGVFLCSIRGIHFSIGALLCSIMIIHYL